MQRRQPARGARRAAVSRPGQAGQGRVDLGAAVGLAALVLDVFVELLQIVIHRAFASIHGLAAQASGLQQGFLEGAFQLVAAADEFVVQAGNSG